jgi:hypothetical protein
MMAGGIFDVEEVMGRVVVLDEDLGFGDPVIGVRSHLPRSC